MVDVSHKAPTLRTAVARGYVQMNQETFGLIKQDRIKKGNVLSVAQIAGIQGAKSCPQLVPLCHPISLTKVSVSLELLDDAPLGHRVEIESQARCKGETGVEMEALCAVSAAALTIFDMCKAVSKEMRIGGICVKEKSGGKSGDWCSSKVE
ncbi:molybdenum cofactor biosynthesis protein C [Coemansia mojavensis]|nr:molybdenum cofactor biosynthesis protein C [Coemansia mojavensis]